MSCVECTYCSDEAKGLDVDGDPVCGDAVCCGSVVAPLPRVIEVSDEEDEEDDAEDEEEDDDA